MRAIPFLLVLTSCRLFGADLPCDDDDDCRPGDRCVANLCSSGTSGVVVDAGVVELPWFDRAFAIAVELEVIPHSTAAIPVVVDAPVQSLVGAAAIIDAASARVVEHAGDETIELPSTFSSTDGNGLIAFALPNPAVNTPRALRIYFTIVGEPAVDAPSYAIDDVRDDVEGPTYNLTRINEAPLDTKELSRADGEGGVTLNLQSRIFANGVDHGSQGYIANENYELIDAPSVRLDEPNLVVITAVAQAGVARLRRMTVLAPDLFALEVFRIEASADLGPLDFYVFADIDVPTNDGGNDNATVDVDGFSIVDNEDVLRGVIAHDGAAVDESVNELNTLADQVFNRGLDAGNVAGPFDVAGTFHWLFSSLNAGKAVVVRDAAGIATSEVEAAAGHAVIDDAPSVTLGAVLSRPAE